MQRVNSLVHLSLYLVETAVEGEGIAAVGKCLAPLQNLKHLELRLPYDYSSFGPVQAASFSAGLARLSQLESLVLERWGIHVGNDGVVSLAGALAQLTCLTSLDIEIFDGRIDADGVAPLARSLSHLPRLTSVRLALERNRLRDEGGAALANALPTWSGNLKRVKLELRECELAWESVDLLLQGIRCIAKLAHLYLDLNENFLRRSAWGPISDFKIALASRCPVVEIGCFETLAEEEVEETEDNGVEVNLDNNWHDGQIPWIIPPLNLQTAQGRRDEYRRFGLDYIGHD